MPQITMQSVEEVRGDMRDEHYVSDRLGQLLLEEPHLAMVILAAAGTELKAVMAGIIVHDLMSRVRS